MSDLLVLQLDKYLPHEIVELLEADHTHESLLIGLNDFIEASFCEDGALEEEWRQLTDADAT